MRPGLTVGFAIRHAIACAPLAPGALLGISWLDLFSFRALRNKR
jgi:hypothetical protein